MGGYTPGAWTPYVGRMSMDGGLNPLFKGIVAVLKMDGGDNCVAVITDSDRPAFDYEANAMLMAEAPALLEALQEYMSQFGQALEANGITLGPTQHAADAKARSAISRATGSSTQGNGGTE